MRYHIASLVAVFLALTVGLLLGSFIVDQGVLANQQERLLESIRADVNKINEQNGVLQFKVKQLDDFQTQVMPFAVQGRLADSQVAVATLTDGQKPITSNMTRALEMAGAKTFLLDIKVKKLDFSDKDLVAQLGAIFGAEGVTGGDFERQFWTRFASELEGEAPPVLTDELVNLGLISFDTSSIPIKNMVVVAAPRKQANNRDVLFVDALIQSGRVRVVGVETSDTKPSRITAYKLRKVSTVDNVDEVPGKISLVYLLTENNVTAHFGSKSTADKLMP